MRQQCVYESDYGRKYSKSTICDFLLMVNSNYGRITYRLRDFIVMLQIAIFALHCILIVDLKRPAINVINTSLKRTFGSSLQQDTLGHTPTLSVADKSCHLCFLPGEPHLLQVFVDCAPPVRSWSTWSSLVTWHLPVQRLLWYARLMAY